MTKPCRASTIALATAIALSLPAAQAVAGVYPGNKCVSDKIKAAAKKCQDVLGAWGKWDKNQNDTAREAKLLASADKFDRTWAKADEKAAAKGVACDEATLSRVDMETLIDAKINEILAAINDGLTLSNSDDAKCGSKLLKAAAKKCGAFLKAESKFVKKPDKDPAGAKREADLDKASTKFSDAWDKATAGDCPTTATKPAIEDEIDGLSEDVVLNTTTSPYLDDTQYTTITPGAGISYDKRVLNPTCSGRYGADKTYHFFVKRGSTNKLLMYYQGGGACWDFLTCDLGLFDEYVNVSGSDNPNNQTDGFADRTNPLNPFREWNVVFVPYCTGDVHWGDSEKTYFGGPSAVNIEHRGFVNAKVAEKWAREHFVNPEEVFVSGTSAGAYGATLHGTLLHEVYPASKISVLPDAGNGIITQAFLEQNFGNWNVQPNIPSYIPGLDVPIETLSIPGMVEAVANYYPETAWGHYTTAYDGGMGGQTGFYNVMLNPTNPLVWPNWWNGSCAWGAAMRQQAIDTYNAVAATTDNYRYYIGTGSRHGVWGMNKVYTDTTGGVPTIVDWVNSMRERDVGWVNVEAANSGLTLAGDPMPSPLQPPFIQVGPDVVITCP